MILDKGWVYLAAIVVQALLAGGQIMLKIFAGRLSAVGWSVPKTLPDAIFLAAPGIGAGMIYVFATGLWVFVLQYLPVNRAFLFVSLAFLFVPLASHFVLGEQIDIGVYVGTALIISGITVGALL